MLNGFVEQLGIATEGLYFNNKEVCPKIAKGWPPKACLDALAGSGPTQISITVPPGAGKDVSRFLPDRIEGVEIPVSITATLSTDYLGAGDSATITISLADSITSITAYDSIGLRVESAGEFFGGVATGATNINDLATALAADINTRTGIESVLSAGAADNVVTITNNSGEPVPLNIAVGNVRADMIRFHRELERVDLNVWAGSNEIKDLLADAMQIYLAKLQRLKFVLDSGEMVTVRTCTRFPILVGNPANVYRETFIVYAEYAVTEIDKVYSILVLSPTVTRV